MEWDGLGLAGCRGWWWLRGDGNYKKWARRNGGRLAQTIEKGPNIPLRAYTERMRWRRDIGHRMTPAGPISAVNNGERRKESRIRRKKQRDGGKVVENK
jgi:hypothetical protein